MEDSYYSRGVERYCRRSSSGLGDTKSFEECSKQGSCWRDSAIIHIPKCRGLDTVIQCARPFTHLKLTASVDKYPSLQFTVIVNADTGPGNNTLLDQNYARELPKLNSRQNVQTIGYVRTNWGTRNISDVLQDVSTYSAWANNKTADYKVHGIFYDEVPSTYSSDTAAFMSTLDRQAKMQSGFGGINFVLPQSISLISGRA